MWDIFVNIDWVLGVRNEILTPFFKLFPFLVSELVYFSLVALGYWFTGAIFYRDLGILICSGTLTNYFLKVVFKIPRPSVEPLIDTLGTFGFPSGDIQVALMVWGLLALRLRQRWFWILSFLIVGGIGFSRLYLGVHTPLDLLGGCVIGLLFIGAYKGYVQTSNYQKIWIKKPYLGATILGAILSLYFFYMWQRGGPPYWLVTVGALGGICLSIIINLFQDPQEEKSLKRSSNKVIMAYVIFSLLMVGIKEGIPFKTPLALVIKGAVTAWLIFCFIPWVMGHYSEWVQSKKRG
jgi:membrane-associated phospholipid phosphatase